MTFKQKITAASRGERAESLPFFHYWRHSSVGEAERECRNRGLGIGWIRPPHTAILHDVDVEETRAVVNGRPVIRTTFRTPLGSLYQDEVRDSGVYQWKMNRGWTGNTPLKTSHMVKTLDDYKILNHIIRNTEYKPDYFPIEQAMDWLGEDGIVLAGLTYSPMQSLLFEYVGCEGEGNIYLHQFDNPEVVEETYRALCESREPLYEIAARSPADIVMCGDNIDSVIIPPDWFERFTLPVYKRQAEILHKGGKLMAVHMDGRLKALKDLIGQSPVDIVEGFHPPAIGDLPLGEALIAWPDKVIWVGFPGPVYGEGPEAAALYATRLLKEMGSGERVVIEVSTENQVSNENLRALTGVCENAVLPLGDRASRV